MKITTNNNNKNKTPRKDFDELDDFAASKNTKKAKEKTKKYSSLFFKKPCITILPDSWKVKFHNACTAFLND